MRLQGEGPQEPVVEEYHSRATDVPSPSKATAKKTMRQIAEEAKTAGPRRSQREKERLLAQRQKSARHSRDHSARHSSGGGHGNKHDFLTAWDNAYEEDALRFEIEQRRRSASASTQSARRSSLSTRPSRIGAHPTANRSPTYPSPAWTSPSRSWRSWTRR